MRSVDGSERADTLLLKRIGMEYQDTTGLRLEHRSQWSHSKELSTTPSPHIVRWISEGSHEALISRGYY